MSIEAVQARMETIETRFDPKPNTLAPAGSGAEFAALLEEAGSGLDGSLAFGAGSLLGSASTDGTSLLGSGSSSGVTASLNSLGLNGLGTASLGLTQPGLGSVPGTSTGLLVVAQGMQHLGAPYEMGGIEPSTGFDSSGLVQRAYRDVGVNLPRASWDQARMGIEVSGLDAAQPGDLVGFGSPVDHVALYVGDGKILEVAPPAGGPGEAEGQGDGVRVAAISRPVSTVRRIVASQTNSTGFAANSGWSIGSLGSAAEVQYQTLFDQAGARHGIDPALLAAVASVESGFNPGAQSPAGAQGLMQFMPATAKEMGVDPLDPASAIDGAARYLKREIDRFGSIELAAAAYNAGPGAVSRYGGVPPYSETQTYVKKVISAYEARR